MTQEQALSILKSGQSVFLTGSAGTGKTYVLNQYIQYLKARKVPVAVTASTGIAATHMNGMTIHAWSGIGIKDSLTPKDLLSMEKKKYLSDHLSDAKVLVIDEISMLHRNQLDMVHIVLQHFKGNQEPFGGVQLIASGDFFQLPPVGNEPVSKKFAFMAPSWLEANFTICYLTEQYRQDDNELNKILNEIRTGKLSSQSEALLTEAENNTLSEQKEITKLYTHNVDVDRININQLNKLTSEPKKFKASLKGNEKLLETLKKAVLAPEFINLKEGAKVMFVKNNPDEGYINGTLGEVAGFTEKGFPIVRLLNGEKIETKQEQWTIDDDSGKPLATFAQIPIRLAWAITVHKSQGMTLDSAEIDLSKTFEKGQGYVALSRLRNFKNLRLLGFNPTALQIDSLALKADKRFQELSNKAEIENLDGKQLETKATQFLKTCGGITDEKEIQKQEKKLKEKAFKKSTYEITKALVDKKCSLETIVEERALTKNTIIGHFVKLKNQYPSIDLSLYKPKKGILEKISSAHNKILAKKKEGEPISLTALYKALDETISYEDIKLGLLFL